MYSNSSIGSSDYDHASDDDQAYTEYDDYEDYGDDGYTGQWARSDNVALSHLPCVLVVGEKPLVAKSLERALRNRPFLDFDEVRWVFASTRGHLLELQFRGSLPSWDWRGNCYHVAQQAKLFDLEVEKVSKQEWVDEELLERAEGIDFLVLCLDNDLEGESIAAEVESLLMPQMRAPRFDVEQQVWRCKFSSLDEATLQSAMALPPHGTLQQINRNFVAAVAVRRELDLRLGFAFSRAAKHIVWNTLLRNSSNDSHERILRRCQDAEEDFEEYFDWNTWPVLSYGPCQLPTLGFVEKSYIDVTTFVPKPFWKVKVVCQAGQNELVGWSQPILKEHAAESQANSIRNMTMPPKIQSIVKRTREGYRKPLPLNTVSLLELASDVLGIAPDVALGLAEGLYLNGSITYPRTETTVYELGIGFEDIIAYLAHSGSQDVREYARTLLDEGVEPPRQDGVFMGDHTPIIPRIGVRPASRQAADLYDLICRVFLASLSRDTVIEETTVQIELPFKGCTLTAKGFRLKELGWIRVLPTIDIDEAAPPLGAVNAAVVGETLQVLSTSVERFAGDCPKPLTEARLLATMEAHGIGTDASMPGHIAKIVERKYVSILKRPCYEGPRSDAVRQFVPSGWFEHTREVRPTRQGSALFRWYMTMYEDLALPSVRANVETAYLEIAEGELQADDVLREFIDYFKDIFWYMFESPDWYKYVSSSLVKVLCEPADRLSSNKLWKQGAKMVRQVKFEVSAKQSCTSSYLGHARSAPADDMIDQCLMADAVLMSGNGRIVKAIDLSVGDTLQAVFEHLGCLQRGLCSVKSVKCYQPRERDVTSITCRSRFSFYNGRGQVQDSRVQCTSNHFVMAKDRNQAVSWDAVVARQLRQDHVVAFDHFPHGFLDGARPGELSFIGMHNARECVKVIEIELDSGDVAVWLGATNSVEEFIGSFGQTPQIRNTLGRQVAIWSFSRSPKAFRHALRESPELEACRAALLVANYSYLLPSGGHMFVRPEEAKLVLKALQLREYELRPSEVVISPEFETRLEAALGLVPRRENLHRRNLEQVRLDSALGCLAFHHNGRPFRYMVDGVVVQGRRTFLELGEDGNVSGRRSPATV